MNGSLLLIIPVLGIIFLLVALWCSEKYMEPLKREDENHEE